MQDQRMAKKKCFCLKLLFYLLSNPYVPDNRYLTYVLSNLLNNPEKGVIISILQMGKLRLTKVKQSSKGHPAKKGQV